MKNQTISGDFVSMDTFGLCLHSIHSLHSLHSSSSSSSSFFSSKNNNNNNDNNNIDSLVQKRGAKAKRAVSSLFTTTQTKFNRLRFGVSLFFCES